MLSAKEKTKMKINDKGYVESQDGRVVHLVKHKGGSGYLPTINLPKQYVGKRCHIKIEFID